MLHLYYIHFYVKLSMDGDMAFSYDGPLKAEVEYIADLRRSHTDEDSLIEDLIANTRTFQSGDIDFDKLYLWEDKDLLVYFVNNAAKERTILNSDGSIDYIKRLGEIAVITEFYTDNIISIVKRVVPAEVIAKAIASSYSNVISKAEY